MAGAGYVVICLGFGLAGGWIGRTKGSSFWLWFLIAGLVPFAGLLAAIFYRWDDRELRRQCHECGKVVKLYDAVCMSCGAELEFPEVAIASEATMRERAA
jgi:membrane protein implicated in regulation of membrane protease activity